MAFPAAADYDNDNANDDDDEFPLFDLLLAKAEISKAFGVNRIYYEFDLLEILK